MNLFKHLFYFKFILFPIILVGCSSQNFRKKIEKDPDISKVEFPTPDLTKSKDISFAIKLRFKK